MAFRTPERYRERIGESATTRHDGNNGVFIVPVAAHKEVKTHYLRCAAIEAQGWEMLEITIVKKRRTPVPRYPNAVEVLIAKKIFWEDDDVVARLLYEGMPTRKNAVYLFRKSGRNFSKPPIEKMLS